MVFSFFFCFAYKIFAVTILNITPLTERTFQSRMLTFFEKKQFSLQFSVTCYRFTLCTEFLILVSVCTKWFAYLLCWPRGRGVGLACTRSRSNRLLHVHGAGDFCFMNFTTLCLLIFKFKFFFLEIFFFLPATFTHTHTHDLYPLTTTFS